MIVLSAVGFGRCPVTDEAVNEFTLALIVLTRSTAHMPFGSNLLRVAGSRVVHQGVVTIRDLLFLVPFLEEQPPDVFVSFYGPLLRKNSTLVRFWRDRYPSRKHGKAGFHAVADNFSTVLNTDVTLLETQTSTE